MEITNQEMLGATYNKFLRLDDVGLRKMKEEAINCLVEDFKGYLETLVAGGMQNDFLDKEARFFYSISNLKWINWEDNRRFLQRRDNLKKETEAEEQKIINEGIAEGFDPNNLSAETTSADTQLHSDITP